MKTEQLYMQLAKAIEEAPSVPICQTTDPELWFPEVGQNFTTNYSQRWAVKMCQECPVRQQCAEYAIAANEPYGLWGGLTPRERQQIRSARRRRPKLN